MKIEFALSPTSVVITVLGEKGPLKDHPGFSKYGCTFQNGHEATVFAKDSETIGTGTNSLVEATVNGVHKVYATLSAFHGLKGGSSAPEKPSQDAKYTGGAQPPPPAQQAAEKPKDYPWASGPLPEGEHTHTIEVLIVAPQMKDGVHRSYTNPKNSNTTWKYDVAYVLDGFRRKATWESASSSDPMLPLGQHQMVITVKGNFASIKKPRTGNGFGGGSAPADPVLALLAGIVANPNIKREDWEGSLVDALSLYNQKKGIAK